MSPGPPSPRGPATRRRRFVQLAIVLGIAIAVASGVAITRRAPRGTAPAQAPADPFAAADPESVYHAAVRLIELDRDLESLPLFRASVARVRQDFWELHFNYFAALRNTALEDTVRLGVRGPFLRTSFERVALMREALRELDRAEALAPSPDVLALIRVQRGRTLRAWGMGWDAWLAFRLAAEAVSRRPFENFIAEDFTDLMMHPTRPPRPHEVREE